MSFAEKRELRAENGRFRNRELEHRHLANKAPELFVCWPICGSEDFTDSGECFNGFGDERSQILFHHRRPVLYHGAREGRHIRSWNAVVIFSPLLRYSAA